MAAPMRMLWSLSKKEINNLNFIIVRRYLHNNQSHKMISVVGNQAFNSPVVAKLTVWMKFYEDIIGLTEVKEAQKRVLEAEKKFLDNQEQRRDRQRQIQLIQMKLKEIQLELDKTLRGEDRYLQLVTQEHSVLKEERNLTDEFKFYEKGERECFSALSSAVRDSHEKERAYAEKTKYWSIIGSVCGAIIGIVGTTFNNWTRMRELKDMIHDSAITASTSVPNLQALLTDMSDNMMSQQEHIASFLTDVRQSLNEGKTLSLTSSNPQNQVSSTVDNILSSIKQQDQLLQQEMTEIKALLTARHLVIDSSDKEVSSDSHPGAVVYLGSDVERLVKDAQHNLEWKIKINSLATVAMIYGAMAVSVPILYKLFGGTT